MTLKRRKMLPGAAEFTQPPPHILYVPLTILQDTSAYFLPYYRSSVETACYWFGIEIGTCQVVTTLAIPRLYQTMDNYSVDTLSSRRLATDMGEQGLINLAQVHTHPPRCGVKHSYYDDQHAYSTRESALSLVWPDYGCTASYNLSGVGVHERREGYWVQLTEAQVTERIHIVDSVADYRWEIMNRRVEENNDNGHDF